MRKRNKRNFEKAAARAPNWLRDIAASKSWKGGSYRKVQGTFGAASEVRKIDPKEWRDEKHD